MAADAGVVLEELSEAEIALVARLDGSLDLPGLHAVAVSTGVAPGRVAGLLQALRERHLLLDLPTDRALLGDLGEAWRAALRPDADALAAAYQLAGDGYALLAARRRQHVVVGGDRWPCRSPSRPCCAPPGSAGSTPARPPPRRSTSTCVTTPAPGRSHAGGAHRGRGAAVRDRRAVAAPGRGRTCRWSCRAIGCSSGPLVTPGRGPCLRCLDLHRCDRDPAWPALLAQLALPAPGRAGARGQPRDHADGDGGGALRDGRAHGAGRAGRAARRVAGGVAALAAGGAAALDRPSAVRLLRLTQDNNGPVSELPRKAVTRTVEARRRCRWASPGAPPSASASGSAASRPSWSPPRCRPAPPSRSSRCSASSRAAR